jgi:hypothetical protein
VNKILRVVLDCCYVRVILDGYVRVLNGYVRFLNGYVHVLDIGYVRIVLDCYVRSKRDFIMSDMPAHHVY